ncbi:MAG: group 1 truncated hemoglobin [Acidimicrobiia bacterium]
MSLYEELGGDEAISAALDAFYVKIFADPRVSGYFVDVDMPKLKGHARAFLALAFGGPDRYMGRDLRTVHERPRSMGLDDSDTDVFFSHFREVLEEFGVDEGRIAAVMDIAEGGRSEVLAVIGRPRTLRGHPTRRAGTTRPTGPPGRRPAVRRPCADSADRDQRYTKVRGPASSVPTRPWTDATPSRPARIRAPFGGSGHRRVQQDRDGTRSVDGRGAGVSTRVPQQRRRGAPERTGGQRRLRLHASSSATLTAAVPAC